MDGSIGYLYCPKGVGFDAEKWVCTALMTGFRIELQDDGHLMLDVSEADETDAILLMGWLGQSHEAVGQYLRGISVQ